MYNETRNATTAANAKGRTMTETTLQAFRDIADKMMPDQGWQWIGPHMSQRMFGISEKRAKDYAAKFGGEAKPMES